jgi:predicted RNase H-like HicB family nuclease
MTDYTEVNRLLEEKRGASPIKIEPIPEDLGGGFMASIPSLGEYAACGDGDTPEEAYDDMVASVTTLLQAWKERVMGEWRERNA